MVVTSRALLGASPLAMQCVYDLLAAARRGDIEAAQAALDVGADIEEEDSGSVRRDWMPRCYAVRAALAPHA